MRPAILLFGILLAFDPAQVGGAEQEPIQATIWNASDEDIVVVIQAPSRPGALLRTVQVPSRTVVVRIPLPKVEEDLLAVAFKARETPDGLEPEQPAQIVGIRKIFPRDTGPRVNSTLPILKYRSYEPRELPYSDQTPLTDEEDHYHNRALIAPVYTTDAQAMLIEAKRSAKAIAYEGPE